MGTLLGLNRHFAAGSLSREARVTRRGDGLEIKAGRFWLFAPVDTGNKVAATIPEALFDLADEVRPGGGACNSCNSCLAIRSID